MKSQQILQKIKKFKYLPYGTVYIDCSFDKLRYKLLLLTNECVNDANIIKLLASWRKKHEFWFPAQFEVTLPGTKIWLKQKIIDTPDRLLFMIRADNQYIGHIGLFRFNFDSLTCEIDNIVRGESSFPGIMTNAIPYMMDWGKKELGLMGYTLETSSDNERAFRLYQRLGFIELKRTPAIQIKKAGRVEWTAAPKDYQGTIKRHFVYMKQTKKYSTLVTGASRGIGLAIADNFRSLGYEVATPTRQEMDLFSNQSIDNYLSRLKDGVDILVNNAGINLINEAVLIEDKEILDTLQVNLIAPIRITRALVPQMIKKRFGRIVNISSIWSMATKKGRLTYSASKSGLSAATRTLAVELAKYNILVNAVAPGIVNTEMTRKNNSPFQLKQIAENLPIKRLADPSEIAEVVSFLCSDKNTYLTGQTIYVDGGYTCL